jgi:hypothetical protein
MHPIPEQKKVIPTVNKYFMIKELVTIEFRYYDIPENENFSGFNSKTITVGVFDTFDEAIVKGNEALEIFEKHFKLNKAWNRKARFSKNGGVFGSSNRLITQLTYLQTPFEFYAKIQQLKHIDVEKTIIEVLDATKRFREYRLSKQED